MSDTPASIGNYFRAWTEDVVAAEHKAYDDDEFAIGIDWQLTDFMRRLGFVYPINDTGTPTGQTYYLKIRRQRPPPTPDDSQPSPPKAPDDAKQKPPAKPWWKIW